MGVLLSRLPTLAVIGLTAVFFGLLTLVLWPSSEVRQAHHSKRHGAVVVVDAAQHPAGGGAVKPAQQEAAAAPAAEQPSESTMAESHTSAVVVSRDDAVQLSPAPDMGIAEKTPEGILPAVGDDGRKPWQVYARPFEPDRRPRIAVIIAPLGSDRAVMNAAIDRLPGGVTLAFEGAMAARDDGLARARKAGHETLLVIPAEPFDYPSSDPGPDTLLTSLPAAENIKRLHSFLRQGSGYIGLMSLTGTRFFSVPKAAQVLLDEMDHRGLALLDTKLTERGVITELAAKMKLPMASIDFRINPDLSSNAIDLTLAQVERTAKQAGHAVCLVVATPLAIDRLNNWLAGLPDVGMRLTPLSVLLN